MIQCMTTVTLHLRNQKNIFNVVALFYKLELSFFFKYISKSSSMLAFARFPAFVSLV